MKNVLASVKYGINSQPSNFYCVQDTGKPLNVNYLIYSPQNVLQLALQEENALVCRISLFPWCKYSHLAIFNLPT